MFTALNAHREAPIGAPQLDRVYIGSTSGELFALDSFGKPAFKHKAKAAIEAPVTLDAARGELYATSVDGTVAALDASTGAVRWAADRTGRPTHPEYLFAVTPIAARHWWSGRSRRAARRQRASTAS